MSCAALDCLILRWQVVHTLHATIKGSSQKVLVEL
jgi:hypothetical protein